MIPLSVSQQKAGLFLEPPEMTAIEQDIKGSHFPAWQDFF